MDQSWPFFGRFRLPVHDEISKGIAASPDFKQLRLSWLEHDEVLEGGLLEAGGILGELDTRLASEGRLALLSAFLLAALDDRDRAFQQL